jgi:[ribosomal protein S18]-alanine N-acetyltransferase
MKANPASIAIRAMTPEDVTWAQRLADGSPLAPQWSATAYLAAVDPQSSPRRIALVGESSGTVSDLGRFEDRIESRLGLAVASLLAPEAELETIVVAPAARRQGVARELFHALAHELRSAGASEVMLEVRCSNLPALGLYRALGFVEFTRRPRYYVDPVEDAVLMRIALA